MSDAAGLAVLDALVEPIAVLDRRGIIRAVNAAWRQFAWLYGGRGAAVSPIGLNYLHLGEGSAVTPGGADGARAADGIRAVTEGSSPEFHLEYPCHSLHEQRWFRMTVTRLAGSTADVVVSHRNITPVKRAEIAARLAQAMLRQACEEDPLTDLPNRSVLLQRLEALVERSGGGPGFTFAVLFLHMDRFGLITDALGHEAADELIVVQSRRLRDAGTADSFAARVGDHEFVHVAIGVDSKDAASAVAERLRAVLCEPHTVHGRPLQTTVSIGITMGGAGDAHDLLRRGAIALNEARQSAPGSTRVFDQLMLDRRARQLRIEIALRQGVLRREFRVLYQPVVAIDSGRLMAAEPGLTWSNPEFGMSASEFLSVADEVGLGAELNGWMLRESCVQWSDWQRRNPAAAPALLSVKASRAQVASGAALLEGIRAALEGAGMPARALQIHVAERDLTSNPAAAFAFVSGLRNMGVRVAMDGFGTGSSSLASLRGYPFDSIQIDKSVIANIVRDPLARAVAGAAIRGIEELGLVSMADGIDAPPILVMLQNLHCTCGQGPLFAQPMPAERLLTAPERYI